MVLHKDGKKKIFKARESDAFFDDSGREAYWSKALPNNSIKVAGEGVKVSIVDQSENGDPTHIKVARG